MTKFTAKTLDGELIEFSFADIGTVFKDGGTFTVTNQPISKAVCLIETVEIVK